MDIRWGQDLSVGDEALDSDHQSLIDLINAVSRSGPTFAEIFSALIDYTAQHFDREETYLKRIGYPDLDRHRALHDGFVERLSAMLKQHSADALFPADQEVADFLWDWLKNHIEVEDLAYAEFAKSI